MDGHECGNFLQFLQEHLIAYCTAGLPPGQVMNLFAVEVNAFSPPIPINTNLSNVLGTIEKPKNILECPQQMKRRNYGILSSLIAVHLRVLLVSVQTRDQ